VHDPHPSTPACEAGTPSQQALQAQHPPAPAQEEQQQSVRVERAAAAVGTPELAQVVSRLGRAQQGASGGVAGAADAGSGARGIDGAVLDALPPEIREDSSKENTDTNCRSCHGPRVRQVFSSMTCLHRPPDCPSNLT